mgnify:FL=1
MKRGMVLVAALMLTTSLYAQQTNVMDQPYIEVSGQAEVEVVPDKIYVQITIDGDSKGQETVLQQEKEMVQRFDALGIDVEKKLVVQELFNSALKSNKVTTFKMYRLEVNSATQLAHVFQALQAIGIAQAEIESVDVSNKEELIQKIRAEAAQNARQNALVLANALGQELGKALYVQDYSTSPYEYMNMSTRDYAVSEVREVVAEAAPVLEFQKVTLNSSVRVRFLLK